MDESSANASSAPSVVKSEPPSGIERFVNSRWTILLLLFGVLGVLGLPLLWVSRGFSGKEKLIWSIVVTIYTLVLLAIAVGCCWFAWQQWQDLMR